MSITRHAPDPLHARETLCGSITTPAGVPQEHRLAIVGEGINCPECRVVLQFSWRCVAASHFVLVKAP